MTVELTLLSRVSCRGQEVAGARLAGLFAVLADDLTTGASSGRLIEVLWPDERPEHPAKALQILVSRARSRFGPDLIVSTPAGYRLALREDEVDASAVPMLARNGANTGDHAAALAQAEAGLALCQGAGEWESAAGDPLAVLRAGRVPAYRSLLRIRALALARLGRHAEAVGLLSELPQDEEVLVELLRCEAATAGPGVALARYDEYRRTLREELGSDPGPALKRVYQELLLADAPVVRRGVRHEPNPLLGRDSDIAAVAGLVRSSRVSSIVGAGGLGKTRLAHAVSRRAEQRVVYFVELAGVGTDDDVTAEVASALGVAETVRGRPVSPLAGIVDALGPGTLLVLDNCEHVVHGAAELVRALVAMSADLRVLTTTRAPLGLSSEAVYPLPELDPVTTVELFGQRARAARPGIELPGPVVAELCGRLDGLPLAVELAAARARVMSVAEIARRLDDRFALLRGGSRDAPTRHRTLHAVIDWSWHLLSPAGRAALRALSVFPGGFTAEAAHQLLGDDALLEVLVDQSLLKVADTESGTRFRMLEAVREFATARRDEAGETAAVIDGFLGWARDLGLRQHESLLSADLIAATRPIRAEQDNLVQALRYALDRSDGASVAATAALLGGLWLTESNFSRLMTLSTDTAWVLSHYRPSPEFMEVTRAAAVLGALAGFLLQTERPLRTLVTLRRLPVAEPDTLIRAAQVALRARDLPALVSLCDNETPVLAGMANYVASCLWENGHEPEPALAAGRRLLEHAEADGSPLLLATAQSRMAELCLDFDPGEPAYRHLEAALAIAEKLGWSSALARGRWALVLADLQRGAFDEAERGLDEALGGTEDTLNGMVGFDICARAEIRLGRGEIEAGLGLWRRAAERVRDDPYCAGHWAEMVRSVAVLTHANHDRLELVAGLAAGLPDALSTMADPATAEGVKAIGSLSLALGMVDLDHGHPASGVRLIALAQRFGVQRSFHPTMDPGRYREIAEAADGPAYAAAIAEYAGLRPDELRGAALAALALRPADRG